MMIEQIAGAALMLLFLADIFMTVLYARAGTGLLAPRWNRLVWRLLKAASGLFGASRGKLLSFAGPLIVILLILFWALGLAVAAALIIQPELGTTIRPSSGDTPKDFVTALLVAGNSLSIVGGGDYSPHSTGTRILYLLDSLIGASVLSLVLSYLVQVYSGLRERNALGLTVDLLTAGTGDAAELLVRLGADGKFSDATSELGNLVRPLAVTKEAHHFYPLLFYFRFDEPIYSVSRLTFVLLDAATLIDTALDREKYRSLIDSAPVAAVRLAARLLLETLDENFPTETASGKDAATQWHWRESYHEAVDKLRKAGIAVRSDPESYVDQRESWEPLVRRVAPTLGYRMDEIDRRGAPTRHADGPRGDGDAA